MLAGSFLSSCPETMTVLVVRNPCAVVWVTG